MGKHWKDLLDAAVSDEVTKFGKSHDACQHYGVAKNQGKTSHARSMTMTQRRRLKSGAMIESRIDLHGETVADACRSMQLFINDMIRSHQRYGLVIHGKGLHSTCGPVLKRAIIALLASHPHVLAHETAQIKHGGSGATYFLLRQK